MIPSKRVIVSAVASAAICIGSVGMPAVASASSHWSKAQCQAYKTSFTKKHKHPTSKQTAEANKTLKSWGCSERV